MQKDILGLVERVTLQGKHPEQVTARIDTGATFSSLDLQLAQQLGVTPGEKRKLVKSAIGSKERPVVTLRFQLRDKSMEEEFTLADRSTMTYPVLIGQNILKKGNFLIDPQKKWAENEES